MATERWTAAQGAWTKKNDDSADAWLHYTGATTVTRANCLLALDMCTATSCLDGATTGSKAWKHGLLGCLEDPKLCLSLMCCPCVPPAIAARNSQRVGDDKSGEVWEYGCASVLAAAFCLGPCYVATQRGQLRRKYDLQGSKLDDCLRTCCCPTLAMYQDTKELQALDPDYHIPMFPAVPVAAAPKPAPAPTAAPAPPAPAAAPAAPPAAAPAPPAAPVA